MDIELGYQKNIIVFDLDDTLYHECDYVDSAYKAIDKHICELFDISKGWCHQILTEAFRKGNNPFDALQKIFETNFPNISIDINELLQIYRFHTPNISLDNDTLSTLQTIQSQGLRMGIITDGRSKSQRNKIEALNITQFFAPQDIIISEEIGFDKTHSEPFIHFVHRFPNAMRFIYIADNPAKDFFYPNILGWKTICLADNGKNIHSQNKNFPQEYLPSITINKISELLLYV